LKENVGSTYLQIGLSGNPFFISALEFGKGLFIFVVSSWKSATLWICTLFCRRFCEK